MDNAIKYLYLLQEIFIMLIFIAFYGANHLKKSYKRCALSSYFTTIKNVYGAICA